MERIARVRKRSRHVAAGICLVACFLGACSKPRGGDSANSDGGGGWEQVTSRYASAAANPEVAEGILAAEARIAERGGRIGD